MNILRSIVITCIVFGSTSSIFAQREVIEYLPNFDLQTIHWGYYLGINNKGYKVSYLQANQNITIEESPGFNVGLIGDLRLHNNINLRFEPGLSTNTKVLYFTNLQGKQDSIREAGGTYLHVPFVLKLSTNRYNNIRPYILGGISYDYNFSSNQDNPDDNVGGQFRLKKHNFMYEMGFGIDLYLYYFKFSPSIRGVFAINNELKYDENLNSKWTGPVDFLGTRGIFINFAFE
ncbi:MAG: porin family protein [Flavobacteriaceae bacterium]|nr:porin family protein [Flavobacteriaceae bacterium]